VPTDVRTLHIHCAARGLPQRPLRPIFEPGRITVQPFMWGFACFQFAMLGVAEALLEGDDEKNRLFPPISYWDSSGDYVTAFLAGMTHSRRRAAHAGLAHWAKGTRLNPFGEGDRYSDHPMVVAARERIGRYGSAAVETLRGLSLSGRTS
jgi:hypothetical protein